MSIPLRYPSNLPISPLRRLSPTIYPYFEACRLKGILSANKVPLLLPKHPRAYLGTIIHDLIAKSNTGRIHDFDRFCTLWDNRVSSIESQLCKSHLTAHLVPLGRNISDMAKSKFHCWETIRNNAEHIKKNISFGSEHSKQPYNFAESWVQTTGGLVGGFIDLIVQEPAGPIIIEYKTGNIFLNNQNQASNHHVIKPEFLTQVYLYAGLFRETTGNWPLKIKIATIDGKKYEIPYNKKDCTSILIRAIRTLSSTNCLIRNFYMDNNFLYNKLASPSLESCTGCNYRPGCNKYWFEKQINNDLNPFDKQGIIREVSRLGDGTQLIYFELLQGNIITIRKVPQSRYDFTREIGRKVNIYNLLPDEGKNNFKSGLLTTFYYS